MVHVPLAVRRFPRRRFLLSRAPDDPSYPTGNKAAKTEIADQVQRVMRGDDGDVFRQTAERRPIEMIVMGVREEDQIDRRIAAI